MKKGLALLLAVMICLSAVPALAGWEVSGGRYWYSYEDGGYAASKWIQDGGKWYYMDSEGWMVTGWRQISGSWYYFRSSGAMVTGWQEIGGSWYYFESSGAMKTGWLQQGDKWYYLADSGAMVTGTAVIGGTEYTFDASGVWQEKTAPETQTGWAAKDGAWYYYGADGKMSTGWAEIDGSWYWFAESGAMATGWKRIDSSWYYFAESGAMKTGWLQQGNDWYYLNDGGAMVTGTAVIGGTEYKFDANGVWQPVTRTGWVEADGGWTYILESGSKATGWLAIKGNWYYFDADGLMKTGWLQQGEDWYYLASTGVMVTGQLAIDGVMYTFSESGVMTGSEALSDIDFNGKTIYIYDWWTGTNWDEADYDSLSEEGKALYDYRKGLETKYNCKIVTKNGTGWDTCGEDVAKFCENGGAADGSYAIFIVEPGQVSGVITDGCAAPWTYDLTGDKWNKTDIDFATVNGKVYGVNPYRSEPRGMLFFNKRVLEEAGVDWNTIYDMQKAGTWTWDAFEKILKQVTRDTDNDGVTDIWGLNGSSDVYYMTAVFANGGTFFDYDENEKLEPTMDSSASLNALNWAQRIKDTYWAERPEEASWDWYMEAWKEGNTAFYAGQSYEGFNGSDSTIPSAGDEWGAVAFPLQNEGGKYITSVSDNLAVIPSVYDTETVTALAEVYDAFTNPAPGYEKSGLDGSLYGLTDKRAVEETYGMLQENEHEIADKTNLLGNVNNVLGQHLLWFLGGEETAAELIEAAMGAWQEMCDTFNEMIANMK